MSFEGYYELLCENGHFAKSYDIYGDFPDKCDYCGAPFTHHHMVDQTNGPDEDCPGTLPAPREEIGHDDDWRADHYGNKYARRVIRYKPLSEWRQIRGEPA